MLAQIDPSRSPLSSQHLTAVPNIVGAGGYLMIYEVCCIMFIITPTRLPSMQKEAFRMSRCL